MATKILELTIHLADGSFKRSRLIRPKITVWKCVGSTRNRVHKIRAASNNLGRPRWGDTVRVEYPMPEAMLVFELTDIFGRKIGQTTLPMSDITEVHNRCFPLVSKGQALGYLVLTLRLIDHTEDQPTATNKKKTSKLEVASKIALALDEVFGGGSTDLI